MRQIVLDGSAMSSAGHFYQALIEALEAPNGHGRSPDAFVDSMIYGGINAAEPPYEVVVVNVGARRRVREAVELLASVLQEARAERRAHRGDDVEVSIRLG